MSEETELGRRAFLRAAGAGAGVAATTGAAAAQGGQTAVDYGDWFSDVPYWGGPGSTVDRTGQDEVSITVGGAPNNAWSFIPAAVRIDPGTTVVWEWTGEGGGHNVVSDSVPGGAEQFRSGDPVGEAGTTYELTFETEGVYTYYCNPHLANGMKGALAVGEVPTVPIDTRTPPPIVDDSARTLGVAAFIAMLSTLGLAYFFIEYGGDYEQ
jgi:halocyanin-like protein